jgi:DNA repair protein RadD
MTTLRTYQVDTIDRTFAELRAGKRSVLVVGPTGMGKTVALSEVIRRHRAHPKGGRVLVAVHRGELVGQTRRKLLDAGLERVGVIAGDRDEDHGAPVLVATTQTLLARGQWPDGVTLLILDEAHHYRADEWRAVPEHYPNAYTIGFTATPERSDGSPLGDIFASMVVAVQTPELIAAGHLCAIDVVAPARRTDGICSSPIEAWREHARGRPTVIFCSSVDAARELADAIQHEGASARAVWGDQGADGRAASLSGFASGSVEVLTNVFVLTEGWDCPRAEVCIIARNCDHVGTFLQMTGRVLRPFASKDRALLVDLCGLVHEHGYPDIVRQFSLAGRAISGAAPTKDCPQCGSEVPLAARECPDCGFQFPPSARAMDLAPPQAIVAE